MTDPPSRAHAHAHVPAVLLPLRAADGVLRRVEMTLLVLVLLLMIGLSFAQVVLRGLQHAGLGQPVPWFEDLDRHFVLWVGMLGASIAAREGRHFGVEALPKMFSDTGRRRLEGALNLVAAIVCALLTSIMWSDIVLDEIPRSHEHHLFVLEGIQVANESGGGTHPFQVEKWWLLVIIPAGLLGMTFRFFLRSLEAGLLTNEQWHWLERELKPDVVAAGEPSADPASLGSGAVIESATPPATQRLQEKEARAASERLERGESPQAPAAPPAEPPAPAPPRKAPTDEVKTYRLGEQSDVADPDARPGPGTPPDEEESLVDSDMLMTDRLDEDSSKAPPTDRPSKQDDADGAPGAGGKTS